MKTRSCKAKGRRLQDTVRDRLLYEWEGILDEDDISGAIMSEAGEDIVLSALAKQEIRQSFECKSHKAFAIYKHYEQAERNCGGREPVLVIKADRQKPLAVVDMEYFLSMVKRR